MCVQVHTDIHDGYAQKSPPQQALANDRQIKKPSPEVGGGILLRVQRCQQPGTGRQLAGMVRRFHDVLITDKTKFVKRHFGLTCIFCKICSLAVPDPRRQGAGK